MESLLGRSKQAFDNRSFEEIGKILQEKEELFKMVSHKVEIQVQRTRSEESSPKNTTLYFSLLLETKDLMTGTVNLLELYHEMYDRSVDLARTD